MICCLCVRVCGRARTRGFSAFSAFRECVRACVDNPFTKAAFRADLRAFSGWSWTRAAPKPFSAQCSKMQHSHQRPQQQHVATTLVGCVYTVLCEILVEGCVSCVWSNVHDDAYFAVSAWLGAIHAHSIHIQIDESKSKNIGPRPPNACNRLYLALALFNGSEATPPQPLSATPYS